MESLVRFRSSFPFSSRMMSIFRLPSLSWAEKKFVTTLPGIPRQRKTVGRRSKIIQTLIMWPINEYECLVLVLTGVEDSSVDPALGVADRGSPAAGVVQEDLHAAGPGRGRDTVCVITTPVPHQHAVVIARVQLFGNRAEVKSTTGLWKLKKICCFTNSTQAITSCEKFNKLCVFNIKHFNLVHK